MELYLAIFCVSLLVVQGSVPPLSPEAEEARRSGGWDGCVHMECVAVYEPVCGSDGKTYPNECSLNQAKCTDDSLTVAQSGECPAADAVRADAVIASPQEDCSHLFCSKDYIPVCGTDHKSYFSRCILDKARCERDPTLRVEYEGLCKRAHIGVHPATEIPNHIPEDCRTMCTMEYDPVCGSDGRTYGNDCELQSIACVQRSGLTLKSRGPCGSPSSPQRMKRSRSCDNKCPKMYKPVCGSDHKTYSNECLLLVENCKMGGVLSVAHKGEC